MFSNFPALAMHYFAIIKYILYWDTKCKKHQTPFLPFGVLGIWAPSQEAGDCQGSKLPQLRYSKNPENVKCWAQTREEQPENPGEMESLEQTISLVWVPRELETPG